MNWDKIKINKDKFCVTLPNGMGYTFKTLKNALIYAIEQKKLYYYEGWYCDIERINSPNPAPQSSRAVQSDRGKVEQNKPQPKRRYHDKARESSGALQ